MRDVYIGPSGEFELQPNQVLKLLKPLYGLADSGDYWGSTLREHFENDLGMTSTTGDAALFFKQIRGELMGMTCSYVDDLLSAGNPEFVKHTEKRTTRFDCKAQEYDAFKYVGMEIETVDEEFQVHQKTYAARLRSWTPPRNLQNIGPYGRNSSGLLIQDQTSPAQWRGLRRLPRTHL
jgi:Reverse transcriptase (RNA-dependent DNA polymerase)